jgi:hypothetical protein
MCAQFIVYVVGVAVSLGQLPFKSTSAVQTLMADAVDRFRRHCVSEGDSLNSGHLLADAHTAQAALSDLAVNVGSGHQLPLKDLSSKLREPPDQPAPRRTWCFTARQLSMLICYDQERAEWVFFDSHRRGKDGFPKAEHTRCAALSFASVDKLLAFLLQRFSETEASDLQEFKVQRCAYALASVPPRHYLIVFVPGTGCPAEQDRPRGDRRTPVYDCSVGVTLMPPRRQSPVNTCAMSALAPNTIIDIRNRGLGGGAHPSCTAWCSIDEEHQKQLDTYLIRNN